MTRTVFLAVAAMAVLATAPQSNATDIGIEVGTLTCVQSDRLNLVLWSEATYACTFRAPSGRQEVYTGEIDKIGVDLTVGKVEEISWTVFAPATTTEPGVLAGTYVGTSADASLGSGAGARLLVGGSADSFTLQPASLARQEGVGLAAGIERFKLTHGVD